MNEYTGYVTLDADGALDFYSHTYDASALYENQYIIIEKELYKFQKGEFIRVGYPTIENDWGGSIKPRNIEQRAAIDMLKDRTSKVKILRGVYGSGKDLLMLNEALELVGQGKFKKIVFIRPNVTVANVPDIGYLKGDLEEKLSWTLGPIYDKVGGDEGIRVLTTKGQLEMVPLLFIRGRSFENSIIYVTEGQNITSEIAKLLLGRVGDGSELWLNGDTHQVDKKVYADDNGITRMINCLAGNPLFSYIYLSKTERGEVANLANLLE